ncbi:Alpha/Beta hydrolase protein [Stachybotrys elegans]|uniref:Palmitoyl-protein thioesterase 1 n=1 Tax=Stachybotrys elegans TaxID=80388 RepID=A0A8K0WV51_9HYPO|nr:Alpha/Beta hydrolase protein [Stachybotrys elegans]
MRAATTAALLASLVLAVPSAASQHRLQRQDDSDDTPLPLVIWHGLGDSFNGEGIQQVGALAEAIHPGTFVYTVALGADANADRSATFFGNVSAQVQTVCDALAAHPILSTAPAVDAIGFSQGGQFLRGYVERCNYPPVRSLVTFGSQHNGIIDFHTCGDTEWLCKAAMALLRFNTWGNLVQSRLVPAQYYRNPATQSEYENYIEHSNFLADINNERLLKNATYKENLASLTNFVMYMFDQDTTVVPKETSWFAEVNGTETIPLRARPLYRENWLGLRDLDAKGGLWFKTIDGDHMQITEQVLNDTMADFFGPYSRKFSKSAPQEERISLEL